jgi:hypothetical protein
MRSLLLVVAVSTAVCIVAAPSGARSSLGSSSFACKVLRKAIAGTPLGHHATPFEVVGSSPTACRYDAGRGSLWVVQLAIQNYGNATARRLVREQCKPMLAAPNYVGEWLTKAETGADVACRIGTLDKDLKTTTNNSLFAKGRWYGELSTVTPSRFAPSIPFLLRRVTAQLAR